jgi:hypothetical protein
MSENSKAVKSSLLDILGINALIEKVSRTLARNSARFETLSITLDDEQFGMLMQSLEEAKAGKIVSMAEAFRDLN